MSTCLSCEKENTAINLTPVNPVLMIVLTLFTWGAWLLLWRIASKFMGRAMCANCSHVGFAGDKMYAVSKTRLVIASLLPMLFFVVLVLIGWNLLYAKPGPGFFVLFIVLGIPWGVIAFGFIGFYTFNAIRQILTSDEKSLKEDYHFSNDGRLWFIYWPDDKSPAAEGEHNSSSARSQ